MNCENKSFMTKKKAFTLIELLIVIAIIGILFIVLVSKVDFATDKAKATGVQTDFRSFQMAFDTVAKENAGFNTFGWDTGDANQDGIRNSYDEGDTNKDGIQNGTEVFTGHKVYAETFTKVFSLKKNGTGSYDRDALNRLETAINANLDPKLHITIKDDGEIVMANGARDPWNREYHGYYISNAESDGKDRGAIVMYSDGANNEFGSEHKIANGVVSISIPGNNKYGKDDYSIVSCYTYVNGYGEVLNSSTGFSNNQSFLNGNTNVNNDSSLIVPDDSFEEPIITEPKNEYGFYYNLPYFSYEARTGDLKVIVFNNDGSLVIVSNDAEQNVPAGTLPFDMIAGSMSEDGLVMAEPLNAVAYAKSVRLNQSVFYVKTGDALRIDTSNIGSKVRQIIVNDVVLNSNNYSSTTNQVTLSQEYMTTLNEMDNDNYSVVLKFDDGSTSMISIKTRKDVVSHIYTTYSIGDVESDWWGEPGTYNYTISIDQSYFSYSTGRYTAIKAGETTVTETYNRTDDDMENFTKITVDGTLYIRIHHCTIIE